MSTIQKVGVVGCGTMGSGIAIVCAGAGFETFVVDSKTDNLNNLLKQSERVF
jgi:3-hydroxybutyryl-CoA dehydrogenase